MSIYQHFRADEHAFIDKVISWKEAVEQSYRVHLTDFLDPREQQIVTSIVGTVNEEIQLALFGGVKDTERKRVIIAPFYEEVKESDFQLVLLQADYQRKFNVLTHRDIMGAFLSLGIDRKKLGDIVVDDGIIQIIAAEEIAPFVLMNLTRIKNATIQLEQTSLSNRLEKKLEWKESIQTVSSMRLDVVIKEIYRISRKNAVEFIQKKAVKVNYKQVEDCAFQFMEGDLISVRGKGRSKLIKVHGQTKKEKWRITTAVLKF
ncbi:RNA-binding protein [Virgibacillus sp. W0181]|uniref:YlmH family RNA-binding protein n=1 Tax=Virgibacillus sp. W0181 TaxID=3391581 RepID=UPI003F457E80